MDGGRARRPVLALAAVALGAAFAGVAGGSDIEVRAVGLGLALLLAAVFVRARGIVSTWQETSGFDPQNRVMHPRSSTSRTQSGPSRKAG